MKMALRICAGIFVAFVLLFLGGSAYVFSKLPSKAQVTSVLNANIPSTPTKKQETKKTNIKGLGTPILNQAPAPDSADDPPKKESELADILIAKMLREDVRQIKICENLWNVGKFKIKEPRDMVTDSFSDIENENPFLTILKVPVYIALEKPKVRALLEDLKDLPSGPDESTLQKLGFYSRVISAYQELQESRKDLELHSDRAYHLFVFARALQLRPELLRDSKTNDFCQQIQDSLLSRAVTSHLKKERKEVLKFLNYAKVSPKDIGFDPEAWTKIDFDLDFKKRTFQFGAGQNRM